MRRLLIGVPLALILFASVAFPAHAASNLPLLDPNFHIVPNAHDIDASCPEDAPLGFGGALQLIQNLMNAGIAIGIIAFVLVTAYAGASFMLNPTNPESRTKARSMLINVVVGMIILLTAWLVVDFIMKVLYDETNYGPWNSILAGDGGGTCIIQRSPTRIPGFLGGVIGGATGGTTGPQVLSRGGSKACNASTVQAAATAGGYRMTAQEANTLACVAKFESACGSALKNYNWNGVKDPKNPSTAYGAFQVTLSGNSACYNNTVCQAAAGVQGSLDCSKGFSNGRPIPGSSIEQACERAAADLGCNATAAACVLKKQGIRAWTLDKNSTGQGSCAA